MSSDYHPVGEYYGLLVIMLALKGLSKKSDKGQFLKNVLSGEKSGEGRVA